MAAKNLSEMAKELDYIGSVTSVGDLPQKMEHAEEIKTGVEAHILERVIYSITYAYILSN